MKCKRFTPLECCTNNCPNIQYDTTDQRFGYSIADDIGLKKIKCKDCYYNTGKCEDCLFDDNEEICIKLQK